MEVEALPKWQHPKLPMWIFTLRRLEFQIENIPGHNERMIRIYVKYEWRYKPVFDALFQRKVVARNSMFNRNNCTVYSSISK